VILHRVRAIHRLEKDQLLIGREKKVELKKQILEKKEINIIQIFYLALKNLKIKMKNTIKKNKDPKQHHNKKFPNP